MPRVVPFHQRLVRHLLSFLFGLLYHSMAWTYDLVAWAVSLGMWQSWVLSALDDLEGPRVLELGHGPGHLLAALQKRGLQAVGLDGSRQMGRLAMRTLDSGLIGKRASLVNGYAEYMPFSSHSFDQVVATFPAEFFWEARTAREVRRVLKPHGRLVAIPLAWITGRRPLQRLAAWLFRATQQAPDPGDAEPIQRLTTLFEQAGFQVSTEARAVQAAQVLVLHARPVPAWQNTTPGEGLRPGASQSS